MNKISTLLFLTAAGISSAFAGEQTWSFEANGGYDFGFGQGIAWTNEGPVDTATYTYFQQIPNSIANSGFHAEAKLGYLVTPDFSLSVGAGMLAGVTKLTSIYSYYLDDGSVAGKWTWDFNYASIRISPSLRYTFLRMEKWNFFAGVGPLFVIPSPVNGSATNDRTSTIRTERIILNNGFGIQSEWGTECRLNEWVGLTLIMALDKISLSRQSEEYYDGVSGKTYFTTYSDKPSTNSNNQTSSDVAKSTAVNIYHTYQSYPDDFSDISLKAGLIFHF